MLGVWSSLFLLALANQVIYAQEHAAEDLASNSTLVTEESSEELNLTDAEDNDNTVDVSELFPNRIVGGQRINITQAPYQVALLYNGDLVCGGSVLNLRWILTAGHCVVGTRRSLFLVRGGSNMFRRGGQSRRVVRAVVHGNYNGRNFANDIAMIKVNKPFVFNRNVQPVRLPSSSTVALPSTVSATGWGVIRENASNAARFLRRAALSIIPKQQCARRYRRAGIRLTRQMICARSPGRDTCQGDSGGPLVSNNVQYGITSFGLGCARRGVPGVYTDVRSYLGWIRGVSRNF